MQTGLLVCTCRGHTAEVTDLAISADNALLASSSNDHTVRCWSLQVHAPSCSTVAVASGAANWGMVRTAWAGYQTLRFSLDSCASGTRWLDAVYGATA